MNNIAKAECRAERSRIIKRRTNERDQTIVTVACRIEGKNYCQIGKNGDPSQIIYTKKVKKGLETLGTIGQRSKNVNCTFPIGQCAEPHAAHKVLQNRINKYYDICDLEFSKAYRSRTRHCLSGGKRVMVIDGSVKKHPYCENCQQVFNI